MKRLYVVYLGLLAKDFHGGYCVVLRVAHHNFLIKF